jgi:hypothetical protein
MRAASPLRRNANDVPRAAERAYTKRDEMLRISTAKNSRKKLIDA